MSADRRLSLVAGLLYLVTFVTSMPALALKQPYLDGMPGADPTALRAASGLEIVLALACLGTAVALFPIVRRHSEPLALGFLGSRTLEAGLVLLGVVGMLAVPSVSSDASARAVLVALHDWAFLIGPGLLPAVNAALLGTALLRARLVPRVIPLVGQVGAPLLAVSACGTLFGWFDQVSVWGAIGALPIALWELALGLWLTFRGVREAGSAAPLSGSYPASGVAAR